MRPAGRVKAGGHLAVNRLTGMIPALSAGTYTLEIVTQYTTGCAFLREARPHLCREIATCGGLKLWSIPARNERQFQ
jgi:hypothetical protein